MLHATTQSPSAPPPEKVSKKKQRTKRENYSASRDAHRDADYARTGWLRDLRGGHRR